MNNESDIYAIVGPTASGKTEIAVALSKYLGNGEVINCDSVQIYREIQVATAKPSEQEKKGITHHLIDYVDPRIKYTAADWASDAEDVIESLLSVKTVPIIAGGTGFYLKSLCEPFFEAPKTDPALRERLTEIRLKKGPEHLYKILTRFDPKLAEKLYTRDFQRVQRALEVYLQTGERLSDLQKRRKAPPHFASRVKVFILHPPRKILYEYINNRTVKHFENGLVDEVIDLRERGIPDDSNALGSHGYRRVCEYLRGERSLESAIAQTQQDIRNYAKRQVSWFKREKGARYLEGFGSEEHIQAELFRHISTN